MKENKELERLERLELALERSLRDVQAAAAESRAMYEQLFITVKGLQKTVDDGVNHLEKWCERLQDSLDQHLAASVDVASLLLSAAGLPSAGGEEVVDEDE